MRYVKSAPKRNIATACLLLGLVVSLCSILGFQYDYITPVERYTAPAASITFLLLALGFAFLPAHWDMRLSFVFKISSGLMLLSGFIEASFFDDTNIEFYLLMLSPYYLMLMFSDLDPQESRWEQWFFWVSSGVIIVALIIGPFEWNDRKTIIMVSVILCQFAILKLFTFLRVVTRKLTKMEERAKSAERVARIAHAAKVEATQANDMKTQFLANMSHELRTPLNAIIGFSDMISQEMYIVKAHEKNKEYGGLINEAGRHLLSIVNDMLDLAKIEAGRMNINEDEFALHELVNSVVQELTPLAAEKKLSIAVGYESEDVLLYADGRMIKQILLSLLSNAIKFTNRGGNITLITRLLANGDLSIEVQDDGIGMEEDTVKHIFEPFRQAEDAYVRAEGGTGLGLNLTKAMVNLHDGRLQIDSQPNLGTNVIVTFPNKRVYRD